MVLLKTFLIIYPKNDKQNSNKSVPSFYKIGILKNFAKFTRKHQCWNLFLNKFSGLQPATLFNYSLQRRCLPVNYPKFLIMPF